MTLHIFLLATDHYWKCYISKYNEEVRLKDCGSYSSFSSNVVFSEIFATVQRCFVDKKWVCNLSIFADSDSASKELSNNISHSRCSPQTKNQAVISRIPSYNIRFSLLTYLQIISLKNKTLAFYLNLRE